MKIVKGNKYRWRTVVKATGLIYENDDIRVVIATACQSLGLGWYPPPSPWFVSEESRARSAAARAKQSARFEPVRSPFLKD